MSTATCKGASNAARQPKALSPSRVAPLFHVSGVARRLQTAAGMCTPRALGRRKKSAATRHGWVFQQAPKAATRYTTTKWPSRGMATLLPQLSFTRTGTLCWKNRLVNWLGNAARYPVHRGPRRATLLWRRCREQNHQLGQRVSTRKGHALWGQAKES